MKMSFVGPGEMAYWLSALAALQENLSSVADTYAGLLKTFLIPLQGIRHPLSASVVTVWMHTQHICMHTHTHSTCIHT